MTDIQFKIDSYNGIIIKRDSLPSDPFTFGDIMKEKIRQWQQEGRKAIWIKVDKDKSDLLPIAFSVYRRFDIHHAKPDYIQLTMWLLNKESKLPLYATEMIAAGGFVVNDKREVLVVKELSGPITGIWKLPAGRLDPGEDVHECAMREVLEETGIKTTFKSIISFRHIHDAQFGAGLLYFICALEPISDEINLQEDEIADCQWMPVDELMALPQYQSGTLHEIMQLCVQSLDGTYQGIGYSTTTSFRSNEPQTVYHNDPKL